MTSMSPISIARRLRDLLDDKRRAGVPFYYVSQIGSDLGISSATVETITGRKLADFIKNDLGYPVASSPETANTAPFVYFTERVPSPPKRVRFAKPFWDAFTSKSSEARFLRLDDLNYGSADELVRSGSGYVEVEQEYQPSSDAGDAPDVTSLRIERWLADKGLGAELFAEGRHRPVSVDGPEMPSNGETVLERLARSLSNEERAYLSLPIEVTRILASTEIPRPGQK